MQKFKQVPPLPLNNLDRAVATISTNYVDNNTETTQSDVQYKNYN